MSRTGAQFPTTPDKPSHAMLAGLVALTLSACTAGIPSGEEDVGASADTFVPADSGAIPPDTGATDTSKKDTGSPPVDTGSPPEDTGVSGDLAQKCVDLINGYRKTLSLAPLARWADAEVCSNGEAQSDSVSGKAHGAFGKCGESAQNECPGWPGPPDSSIGGCLEMMWNEGPGADFSKHGHYLNMSSTKYTKVSCGFFVMPSGSYWAVQNFR